MVGPFKMKGSPMQRNFGISSLTKDEEKKKKSEITSSTDRRLTAAEMLEKGISQKKNVKYYINAEGKVHSRTGVNPKE